MNADELAAELTSHPERRFEIIRAAADGGVAEAQALLGQMLLDGVDGPADPQEAVRRFSAGAAQGHVMAMNMVGRCYELGAGVARDKARAAEWYHAAAARGLDWGMYNYATLLALGDGVAQDRAAALGWFRKAAALGHAKSINYVGSFHEDGWVVERDLVEAERCYRMAAEGGDFRGCFNLTRMLAARGEIAEALEWIARMRETATPSFLAKVANWLRSADTPALREAGDALADYAIDSQ